MPQTISLSDNTPGVKRFYGPDPDGQLGHRVGLGDVNGDGWLDLVMAAYVANPLGCYKCGEIDVVYWNGAMPDAVDLATTSVPVTRLLGEGFGTWHGVNMVVGEVDGDGFADVIVQKEPDDSMIPPERRAVIIARGSGAMPDTVMLRTGSPLTRIFAEQGGDDLGRGLAAVDLNGNTVDDICIGAPFANVSGQDQAGKVRVFPDGAIVADANNRPRAFVAIHPNQPNPFSRTTKIRFEAPERSVARVSVFDVRGQRLRTFPVQMGAGSLQWDGLDDNGRRLPSGVYFCRIDVAGSSATRKMVLLR